MDQHNIALAGNPNSGKTTLFNELTGARQHVGNYPGVTVERKEGDYLRGQLRMNIVDLPGTYSLTAYSEDEVVARNYITEAKPEAVIDIVDASNLERNLYLTVQLLEMGAPICIALNMMDVASRRGINIDTSKMSEVLGVPVRPVIARSGEGKDALMDVVHNMIESGEHREPLIVSYGEDLDSALIQMEELIAGSGLVAELYNPRWVALKYLERDELIIEMGRSHNAPVSAELEALVARLEKHLAETFNSYPEALITDYRYGFISSLIKMVVTTEQDELERVYTSDKIDQVVTHRIIGPLLMLAVIYALYQFTFTYSAVPVGWFEGFFGWLADWASSVLPDGKLESLVVSGIIDGVGGVLGFVPLIMFMFFGIAILEDSGYLARVAYMMDRIFSIFGLHGSSVMAFIVSGGIAGGCAVPGVMATRTLKSRRERIATLLTVPFMNCGAKLPVFALLIGAFFSAHQARMMFIITLISWFGALIVAKILRMTVVRGESMPFVMELPPYRIPTFKGLMIHTWERTWQYIKKAGTVILGISIVLWAMMTFPELPAENHYSVQREALIASGAPDEQLAEIERLEAGAALENSVAGRIGKSMEKVTLWAGFDWRTDIALLGGFVAKEVIVSTLGTAYSLGEVDAEEATSLSERLQNEPGWSPLMAFSLILFVMFYAPCFVTVVCIVREAGSWKWGAFSMIFNTTFAFALAVVVYQSGKLLGLG